MQDERTFLTNSESEKFTRPERCRARSILVAQRARTLGSKDKPEDLATVMQKDLKELTGQDDGGTLRRWFRCWAISVSAEEGMSWTAESIHQFLAKTRPDFRRFCLADAPMIDEMPEISRIIGVKTFLRLAAQKRLTTSFLTLRSWLTPVIVGSSIVLAIAVKVLDLFWKIKSPETAGAVHGAMIDSTFWLVGGASVVVGLLSQHIATLVATRTQSKSMENFLARQSEKMGTNEYDDFVEEIAKKLCSTGFPRFVVIDHFDRRDITTRRVLERYLKRHSQSAQGFLIFADYFRFTQFWGLDTDVASREIDERLRVEPVSRKAIVDEWERKGAGTPRAMIARGNRLLVSAEFLSLGTYIFEEPFDSIASFAEYQRNFDEEAERSLPRLIKLIAVLPVLPNSIKDLLCRHANRLLTFSLPADARESAVGKAAVS